MQMQLGEQYLCKKCLCETTVTLAPSIDGKGGQGSLVCCGDRMTKKQ